MTSEADYDVEQLNSLIETTFDSAEGYRDAADAAQNSRFAALFRQRAAERHALVLDLQSEVRRLGGKPEEEGTTLAAAQRWFANLRNSMTGSNDSIISEVESAEAHVMDAYEAVARDTRISPAARIAITKAYGTIQNGHKQLRELR